MSGGSTLNLRYAEQPRSKNHPSQDERGLPDRSPPQDGFEIQLPSTRSADSNAVWSSRTSQEILWICSYQIPFRTISKSADNWLRQSSVNISFSWTVAQAMASAVCIPCYLTDDPNDLGPMVPLRCFSRSRIHISPEINLRNNEPAVGLIFDLTRDYFAKANIPITEVQSWGHLVVIVLETEPEMSRFCGEFPSRLQDATAFNSSSQKWRDLSDRLSL